MPRIPTVNPEKKLAIASQPVMPASFGTAPGKATAGLGRAIGSFGSAIGSAMKGASDKADADALSALKSNEVIATNQARVTSQETNQAYNPDAHDATKYGNTILETLTKGENEIGESYKARFGEDSKQYQGYLLRSSNRLTGYKLTIGKLTHHREGESQVSKVTGIISSDSENLAKNESDFQRPRDLTPEEEIEAVRREKETIQAKTAAAEGLGVTVDEDGAEIPGGPGTLTEEDNEAITESSKVARYKMEGPSFSERYIRSIDTANAMIDNDSRLTLSQKERLRGQAMSKYHLAAKKYFLETKQDPVAYDKFIKDQTKAFQDRIKNRSPYVDGKDVSPDNMGRANERITEETKGKVRHYPVSKKLRTALATSLAQYPDVHIEVTSGGQDAAGRAKLKSSVRHNHGAVAAGAQGVGAGKGYMGNETLHVGFGKSATWGGASWIKAAHARGLKGKPAGYNGTAQTAMPRTGQRIDHNALASVAASKIAKSPLNGFVPKDGAAFGIVKGTPQEWARFIVALTRQESGLRTGRVAADGSIVKFSTTPKGERSYGPGQFKPGEYGLKTWADVNNPDKVVDAYIAVAKKWMIDRGGRIAVPGQAGKTDGMTAYFGSLRSVKGRPPAVIGHLGWVDKNVNFTKTNGQYSWETNPNRNRGSIEKEMLDYWAKTSGERTKMVQAAHKSMIGRKLKTLSENAELGYSLPPDQLQSLKETIEATKDPAAMAAYNSALGLAQQTTVMKSQSVLANETYLNGVRARLAKSQPGPGQLDLLKKLESFASTQRSELKTDPVKWSIRAGVIPEIKLNIADPKSMADVLSAGEVTQQRFGGQLVLLTKDQADTLAEEVKAGKSILAVSASFVEAWGPENARRALGQINDKMPEAAIAGWLITQNVNIQAAKDIDAAIRFRNDPNYKSNIPPAQKYEEDVRSVYNGAYNNFPPEQRASMVKAAQALYEVRAKGNPEYNSDIFVQALRDVTGERSHETSGYLNTVTKKYGGAMKESDSWSADKTIIIPPNWRQDTFRKALSSVSVADLEAAGMKLPEIRSDPTGEYGIGKPITIERLMNARLVQIDDGKFLVDLTKRGTEIKPGQEAYVTAAPGDPTAEDGLFVLDVNKLESILDERAPEYFWKGR